jgi:hypothetical protein
VLKTRRYFQFIGIRGVLRAIGVSWTGHARVSSSFAGFESICTSGL